VTRLEPLPRDQWGDEVRAALATAYSSQTADHFFEHGMPNVLATLMHHPALMTSFLVYNNALLQRPVLEPRLRELAILRVAHRTSAAYEWAQHVRLADRAGITRAEIDAIEHDADGGWTPLEAAVLAAADQCVDGYCVDDETWKRLAEQLAERQLVELVFVVGTYAGLAMAFNSFGIQLDPELRAPVEE
jgi:4-carboxymuconolactone decarboxylase